MKYNLEGDREGGRERERERGRERERERERARDREREERESEGDTTVRESMQVTQAVLKDIHGNSQGDKVSISV